MRQFIFVIAFFLIVAFGACSNFETSGNGAFDGYWQLEQVDTLATGGTADMHDRLMFWAVQHHLIELCDRHEDTLTFGPVNASVFYHFSRSGDSLYFLADPFPVTDNRYWTDPYATLEQVRFYGFSRFDEAFHVLQMDDDRMLLQSQLFRLHFRKY